MNYAGNSDFVEVAPPPYSMTLLDQSGDTSITWVEADDVDVLTFIQSKIDEGYVFFIERPRVVRAFMKKKKVNDVSEINARYLVIADDKASGLAQMGKIKLTTLTRDQEPVPVKKSSDAKEIAQSRTVATRPLRGG